ncbi:TadE/TadG family type IV pilus assembly protein [Rhizohabitans arisaemae]|uniref:TadE/TadG family type IV pilus assembly protein n=1 Tax=Rhizohabitans arisaemae TaxID=2720610 RepID=UPI0024B20C47|nr:TadE/TadG family type IV pilus assembly protein [Rhizohabitans arisaemae]
MRLTPGRDGRERGSMTAEMVLFAPILLFFLILLVGAGRLVQAQGEVHGAARDAARAASVQRTLEDAEDAAEQAARAALDGACEGGPKLDFTGTEWAEGGSVRAVVTCEISLDPVAFLGFSASREMAGVAVAPLERFRRIE